MTPEAKVKAKVKKVLDHKNCYYFFPATGGYGRAGVPDIVACIEGKFVGIECKANGNKPTLLQQKNLDDIGFSKGIAIVINEDNVDKFAEWLEGELAS